jgi:glycerol uptake facilitator-like aquaporin
MRALVAELIGTFALVSGDLHARWIYLLAPLVGATVGGFASQFVRREPVAA